MRLTVHLPEDLARLLRQAAENEGKSMSALSAEALEAYSWRRAGVTALDTGFFPLLAQFRLP
ncbi:MAG: ribbon-helix-helix domain-containing protein [Thermus sp.]|uniref:ribbon-helix-helix domain-containing protein n=1 Tax=Thermus sp. TaxID=275 RepID=UPI00391BCCEE